MFQKVANMAPTWAQVGAMLGSKIVLDTSKSDTEKNIQKHEKITSGAFETPQNTKTLENT